MKKVIYFMKVVNYVIETQNTFTHFYFFCLELDEGFLSDYGLDDATSFPDPKMAGRIESE
jgi:hypothetical protein